ncbi:MAG: CocE/NonD family hydrolase [Streptosporangiaceae bacterium]
MSLDSSYKIARPRPLHPAAAALGRVLARTWSLPPARNRVAVERDVQVPMSDGAILLADHYLPVSVAAAATVLVRCPYGRRGPFALQNAQLLAERGFHVLLQSCRGTFGSGGEFAPMRNEMADGQDTVAWLRQQNWFDGRLVTYGASYLGFVQWALAIDPPPELVAAVVHVGPHDFGRVAYRNGVFDLYNFLGWSDMMAHQEEGGMVRGLARMLTAERRLRPVLDRMPIGASARDYLGTGATWFESWLEHPGPADPFWVPLRCGAALERIAVPTLIVGGWQDLFIEQSLEQYQALSARGVPTRLVVGPWTHMDVGGKGTEALTESLAWLDRYAAPGRTVARRDTGGRNGAGRDADGAAGPEHSVRLWIGGEGAGLWREFGSWPPPGWVEQRWYLGPYGSLGTREPGPEAAPVSFRYDPADPTPSPGGALLALRAGVRDNRAVEQRLDMLVFSSEPLDAPVEVIGEVAVELSVTRDNPDADLFVRLCDVDPQGHSCNVCDGILRLTADDPLTGPARISLLGAAHRFGPGHRIRLQVAGGAHPRFARNPGTGQVDAAAEDMLATHYDISVAAGQPSVLILPA